MKLIEALAIINAAAQHSETSDCFLACGFEPLHLRCFLNAHLQTAFPGLKIRVSVGVFGDLFGNIQRAADSQPAETAIVVEWSDLDPRLGFRQLAAWTPSLLPDIFRTVAMNVDRLHDSLETLTQACRTALCLPTLPRPRMAANADWRHSEFESGLQHTLAEFRHHAVANSRIAIVDSERLDFVSPLPSRRDMNSELFNGFPYTNSHADIVAGALAALLHPPVPKKGLITDLDDTFWRGILGEAGPEGVSWDATGRAQMHGIYQEALATLSSRGVLVGVASKNDPELVRKVFERTDLRLPARKVYPFSVHWRPKSESVRDILTMWNIGADAVVFIDDSPLELAEVKAAYPSVECVQFPKEPAGLLPLLEKLASWFGKDAVSEEDLLRTESIRSAETWRMAEAAPRVSFEEFLAQVGSHITFSIDKGGDTRRAFELVNKTNQFNLNGKRLSQTEWEVYLQRSETVLVAAAYEDKFGPLGIISVALGRVEASMVYLDAWVMSCRAFSRRIEYQFVYQLFHVFAASEVVFDYCQTARNGPTGEFLSVFHRPQLGFRLIKEEFDRFCPTLFHSVEIIRP